MRSCTCPSPLPCRHGKCNIGASIEVSCQDVGCSSAPEASCVGNDWVCASWTGASAPLRAAQGVVAGKTAQSLGFSCSPSRVSVPFPKLRNTCYAGIEVEWPYRAIIVGPLPLAQVVPVRNGLAGAVRKGPYGDHRSAHEGLGAKGVLDALERVQVGHHLLQQASRIVQRVHQFLEGIHYLWQLY